MREERAFLTAGLRKMSLEVYEGAANFIFFRAPGVTDLHRRTESRGILIRSCGNYRGVEKDYYRVAVRTRGENERLLAVLRAAVC